MGEEESEAAFRAVQQKHLYRYYGTEPPGQVAAFEAEFAAFIGTRHALGVTSGTAALHTALAALGVGPGQEVIVPAYLWVSVVAAVVNRGAIPVLADIDDTFCIDPASVEEKITPRTSGVIAVHMNGGMADVRRLSEIAHERGLFLIEDCAQCVGGSIDGKPVGSFGDAATFSFQINKNMTSGEGGCIVTNDEKLYLRCVACHDTGYIRSEDGHSMRAGINLWGLGYRLDELRAALLRIQLQRLPLIVQNMRASKYRILQGIRAHDNIQFRRIIDPSGDTGGFLISSYGDEETARTVNRILRENGIATASPETSNVVLSEYGLHIYSNIVGLVHKSGIDAAGTPWTRTENRHSQVSYGKGTCPVADGLFGRSIILTISSCLSGRDEDDIIAGFDRAMEDLASSALYVKASTR